jgi:hypothetical protein
MAESCHPHGTQVSFTAFEQATNVVLEQFWGRAVRASRDLKESGALLIFGGFFGTAYCAKAP